MRDEGFLRMDPIETAIEAEYRKELLGIVHMTLLTMLDLHDVEQIHALIRALIKEIDFDGL